MTWLRFLFLLLPIGAGCGSPSGGEPILIQALLKRFEVQPNNPLIGLGGLLVADGNGKVVEANFTGRPLGDLDLAVIAQQGSIQELWLTNTGVTDAGMIHLQSMPNLRVLGLARTSVTDAGLPALGDIRSLREVYLYPNRVSDNAVDALKQRLPGIKVVY